MHSSYVYQKYIGYFKEGNRHGDGILYNKDESILYEGNFENDFFNGEGKYYYCNGDYYIGGFYNGLKDGEGTLYDGLKNILYSGNYKNDSYNGFGILFYPNRNYYEGEFFNGYMHGKGSLYYKDGTIKYKGNFKLGVCEDESKNFDEEGNEKSMSDKLLIKFTNALRVIYKITGDNKNDDDDDDKRKRKYGRASEHNLEIYCNDLNRKFETDSDNDAIFCKYDEEDDNEDDDENGDEDDYNEDGFKK